MTSRLRVISLFYKAFGVSYLPFLSYDNNGIKNDRLVWVGRDHEGHSVPIPSHGQGHFTGPGCSKPSLTWSIPRDGDVIVIVGVVLGMTNNFHMQVSCFHRPPSCS